MGFIQSVAGLAGFDAYSFAIRIERPPISVEFARVTNLKWGRISSNKCDQTILPSTR